jgi:hypothetical protein
MTNDGLLEIIYFDLNNPQDSIDFSNWKEANIPFNQTRINEDSLRTSDSVAVASFFGTYKNYKVYKNCYGEFGGELFFIDSNEPEWALYMECTCPIMVDERADGYYITESIIHMRGKGRVQVIKSPQNLIKVPVDSINTNWKAEYQKTLSIDEYDKKFINPGETIIGHYERTYSIFFPYENKDYLIYTEYDTTYLGEVINNELIVTDTLLNHGTYGYGLNYAKNRLYQYNYSYGHGYVEYDDAFDMESGTETSIYSSGEIHVRNGVIIIAYKRKEITTDI